MTAARMEGQASLKHERRSDGGPDRAEPAVSPPTLDQARLIPSVRQALDSGTAEITGWDMEQVHGGAPDASEWNALAEPDGRIWACEP